MVLMEASHSREKSEIALTVGVGLMNAAHIVWKGLEASRKKYLSMACVFSVCLYKCQYPSIFYALQAAHRL